jgi:hypothetical protein
MRREPKEELVKKCQSIPGGSDTSHRCQDFFSLHGFRLTLEDRQCTQPRPCAQNLGGLWEWPDLSCHSLIGSLKIELYFFDHAVAAHMVQEHPLNTKLVSNVVFHGTEGTCFVATGDIFRSFVANLLQIV